MINALVMADDAPDVLGVSDGVGDDDGDGDGVAEVPPLETAPRTRSAWGSSAGSVSGTAYSSNSS